MSPEKFDTKDLVVTTGEERTKNAHMVTVEHLPSGIGVRCYERKSQAQNYRLALDLLWDLLVKPAPAAPVTDAEFERAITELDHAHTATQIRDARSNFHALIARRIQQATAAAEELARAVEVCVMQWDHADGEISEKFIDDARAALDAFRAARGTP